MCGFVDDGLDRDGLGGAAPVAQDDNQIITPLDHTTVNLVFFIIDIRLIHAVVNPFQPLESFHLKLRLEPSKHLH